MGKWESISLLRVPTVRVEGVGLSCLWGRDSPPSGPLRTQLSNIDVTASYWWFLPWAGLQGFNDLIKTSCRSLSLLFHTWRHLCSERLQGSLRVMWLFYGGDRIRILINQSGLIGLWVASKKGLVSNGLEQEKHLSSRWRGSPERGGDGSWPGAVMSGTLLDFPASLLLCPPLRVSFVFRQASLPVTSWLPAGAGTISFPIPFNQEKEKIFPPIKSHFLQYNWANTGF